MGLKQQIEADIKQAMLAKKKDDLTALRSIKSAILLAETEKGAGDGLNEDQELKILTKAAKQRKDSAAIFKEQGREDLAEKELGELAIINNYLPQQLNEEEIIVVLKEIMDETGASDMKDMGKVMGIASKKLAGKADGKTISGLVKSLLN